jgi:hypothetical protein
VTFTCSYPGETIPTIGGGPQRFVRCLYDVPAGSSITFTRSTDGTFQHWYGVCSGSAATCTIGLPLTFNGAPVPLTTVGALWNS